MLQLQRVEIINGQKVYICNNTMRLSYENMVNLIRQTPAKDRNCKLVNGHISLKQGYGRLQTIVRENKRKSSAGGIVNVVDKINKYDKNTIYDNEAFFINVIQDDAFLMNHTGVLYQVDKARIIDLKLYSIVTPFGATDIRHLSTGCKTLLNVLYLLEKHPNERYCVNINECGENVIPLILEAVAGTKISVYYINTLFVSGISDKLSFRRNGKIYKEFEAL